MVVTSYLLPIYAQATHAKAGRRRPRRPAGTGRPAETGRGQSAQRLREDLRRVGQPACKCAVGFRVKDTAAATLARKRSSNVLTLFDSGRVTRQGIRSRTSLPQPLTCACFEDPFVFNPSAARPRPFSSLMAACHPSLSKACRAAPREHIRGARTFVRIFLNSIRTAARRADGARGAER